MKIAVEGMDGAGKTTVAKAVAEKFGYTYYILDKKPELLRYFESYVEDKQCSLER